MASKKLNEDIKVEGTEKDRTPKKQLIKNPDGSSPPYTTGDVRRIDDFSPGTAREIAQAAQDEEDGRERPAKRRREGEGGRRRKSRTMRRKSRKHRKTHKKRKF